MVRQSPIGHFLDSFFASERLRSQVVFQKTLPATRAAWADPQKPLPDSIRNMLQSAGINKLYRHQAKAIDFIRSGCHVIVATPTASGKTLVYDLPVLEHFLADPDATALYVFLLKALAQDQVAELNELIAIGGLGVRAFTFDGDTPGEARLTLQFDERVRYSVLTGGTERLDRARDDGARERRDLS